MVEASQRTMYANGHSMAVVSSFMKPYKPMAPSQPNLATMLGPSKCGDFYTAETAYTDEYRASLLVSESVSWLVVGNSS
jgi:hypothetical protein